MQYISEQDMIKKILNKENLDFSNEQTEKFQYQQKLNVMLENKEKDYCSKFAEKGFIDMLKHAHEKGFFWDEFVCFIAVYRRDLQMLQYACQNGCPKDENSFQQAAINGDLEIIKYLKEIRCPWDEQVLHLAIRNKRYELIKYLCENDCPQNKFTLQYVIKYTDKSVLDILLSNKHYIDDKNEACGWAAYFEKLDMLKYLHEKGFKWNETTFEIASSTGNLEIVRYLHENGCFWNEKVFFYAEQNDHQEVMQYLLQNGCPIDFFMEN